MIQGCQGCIYLCHLPKNIVIVFNRVFSIRSGGPDLPGNFIQFDTQGYNKIKQKNKREIFIPPGKEQTRIDISSYPAGVYVAVLKSGDAAVARGKFVKH